MEFKYKIIDKNLCVSHFCIAISELEEDYDNYFTMGFKIEDIINEIIIEDEMMDDNYLIVSLKKTKFFTNKDKAKFILGSSSFIVIKKYETFIIPKMITINYDKIDNFDYEEKFVDYLLNNKLYYEVETNTCDLNSIVYYDLIYSKDGENFSKVEDQVFDLRLDEDIDVNIFLNTRVGDNIILDDGDFTISANIKKITRKEIFTKLKYDLGKILKTGYNSFVEFKEEYFKICKELMKIDETVYQAIAWIYNINKLRFNQTIRKFYYSRALELFGSERNDEYEFEILAIYLDFFHKLIHINYESNYSNAEHKANKKKLTFINAPYELEKHEVNALDTKATIVQYFIDKEIINE